MPNHNDIHEDIENWEQLYRNWRSRTPATDPVEETLLEVAAMALALHSNAFVINGERLSRQGPLLPLRQISEAHAVVDAFQGGFARPTGETGALEFRTLEQIQNDPDGLAIPQAALDRLDRFIDALPDASLALFTTVYFHPYTDESLANTLQQVVHIPEGTRAEGVRALLHGYIDLLRGVLTQTIEKEVATTEVPVAEAPAEEAAPAPEVVETPTTFAPTLEPLLQKTLKTHEAAVAKAVAFIRENNPDLYTQVAAPLFGEGEAPALTPGEGLRDQLYSGTVQMRDYLKGLSWKDPVLEGINRQALVQGLDALASAAKALGGVLLGGSFVQKTAAPAKPADGAGKGDEDDMKKRLNRLSR